MNVATWVDAEGRKWVCRLNLGDVRELRDTLGVDLLDAEAGAIAGLLADPDVMGDVVWLLTAKQAAIRGVSREDLVNALDGDSLAAAWGALHDAYLAFCPAANRAEREANSPASRDDGSGGDDGGGDAGRTRGESRGRQSTSRRDGSNEGEPFDAWQCCLNLAASLGVEPWPFSFRELNGMADAARSERWDYTAAVIVSIRNFAFGSKRKTRIQDVHPYYRQQRGNSQRLNREQSTRLLDKAFNA